MLVALSLVSCSRDEPEYYVKYDVSCKSKGLYRSGKISIGCTGGGISTPEEIRDFEWSATKGPFSSGDKVYLNVTSMDNCHNITGSISVSRDGSPFVVKKQMISKENLRLSYTIK